MAFTLDEKMGIQLKEHQHLLRRRVDEILHYMWDPIGVSGTPEARDEYDSYVPRIYGLLIQGKKEDEVSRELSRIESETMGMTTSEKSKKRNDEVSEILISWKDTIQGWDDYHTK